MSRLFDISDPRAVREEYASERGLAARKAAYANAHGPDARELVFEAIAATHPARVLEVGCGEGELAARVQDELGAHVIAIDQSERMVELTRARGVDARVGDVQQLPFGDGEFDCAVAAWMLYHVQDVERAIDELARVVLSGGTVVAVTNHGDHLAELKELLGAETVTWPFSGEVAHDLLAPRFTRVETVDATGTVTFETHADVVAYVRASTALFGGIDEVPEIDAPLVVRRRPVIFVCTK